MHIADRARRIEPFYVMEICKAAQELQQRSGSHADPLLYLNIGEPDFTAPPLVAQAAERCIRDGNTQYTAANGLPALRERISGWYAERFGLSIDPARIVVTAGASAALQLVCMALIEQGDEVLMPDPSYPCNRHFVSAAEGTPRLIPASAEDRFQLNAAQVEAHWTAATRGVLLASPSNPTGTSIAPAALKSIVDVVRARGGFTIVDEIYLGLSYDDAYGHSALELGDDIISINSFSKYFNMTGWRLGWVVLPPALAQTVELLSQHLFICPSTVAQHAALACFEPESLRIYEERRAEFRARRDWFVPQLDALGMHVPVRPDGAFYAWADIGSWLPRLGVDNSWDATFALMERARVVVTPGRDFGTADTSRFVRFSTANSLAQLQEAIARLQRLA
ncbi:pyridoxal phosphate-dependent aminotransferase [Brachymonas sp. M4Q-1]|uniref:pyridoxal phosphate-dependent aminotransferase n=1 Tax=Brachymonas sp. M4Q-1 TaxID=3416906 RepID=UPI003CF446DB